MEIYRRLVNFTKKCGRGLVNVCLISFPLIYPALGMADAICVRDFSGAPAVDGVVAPGVSSGSCSTDTIWPHVGPGEFHPSGTVTESHIYFARLTGPNRLRIGIDTAEDPDITMFDAVMLYFDANNSNTWDAQDFAIRLVMNSTTTAITSGDSCNETVGTVEYYERSDSFWVMNNTHAASITTKYSHDHSQPDPEDKIWNIEFDIPINNSPPFHLNTAIDPYFAVGAYLFAAEGTNTPDPLDSQVRVWPNGLGKPSSGGNITPTPGDYNNLDFMSPAASDLVDIKLNNVCYDMKFPSAETWRINNINYSANAEVIHRNQVNTFRVTYYFDGPGDLATPFDNPNGRLKLGLKPFNGGALLSDYVIVPPGGPSNGQSVLPTEYNKQYEYTYNVNFTQLPSQFNHPDTDFVCAHAWLDGFQYDDYRGNNDIHVNLNYFTTSESRHNLKFYGDELPSAKTSKDKKIYLQTVMYNEMPEFRKISSNINSANSIKAAGLNCTLTPAAIVLLIVGLILLIGAIVYMKVTSSSALLAKILALLGILLILLALFLACFRSGSGIGTARWQFENAAELGIKPVAGKEGWYEMPFEKGDVKTLRLKFMGQPLPYKTQKYRLNPAVNGIPKKVDIPVKPNTVVTVVATGGVDIDGKDGPLPGTSAAGFTEKVPDSIPRLGSANTKALFFNTVQADQARSHAVADVNQRYLLSEGRYFPNQYAGALIGSFDGFKTSFVVGTHRSIIVPKDAKQLSLAVNAQYSAYAKIEGYYDLSVVVTPTPTVPTRTVQRGDATYNIPPSMPSWQTLTAMAVYSYYPDEVMLDNKLVSVTRPWTNARFVIYDSHVGAMPGGQPGMPGMPGTAGTMTGQ